MYRAACVKEFELIVELAGKALRRHIQSFYAHKASVFRLTYKDVFRQAARHCRIDTRTCERWLVYRDLRNETAHDYGEDYANNVLKVLPTLISDASALANLVEEDIGD